MPWTKPLPEAGAKVNVVTDNDIYSGGWTVIASSGPGIEIISPKYGDRHWVGEDRIVNIYVFEEAT